jgi:peptidase E
MEHLVPPHQNWQHAENHTCDTADQAKHHTKCEQALVVQSRNPKILLVSDHIDVLSCKVSVNTYLTKLC